MDELQLQKFKLLAAGYAKGHVIYRLMQLCSGFEGCVAYSSRLCSLKRDLDGFELNLNIIPAQFCGFIKFRETVCL